MSFQKVSFPSCFASIISGIKHNSSVLFLTQTLYTFVKSSSLKCKFLRFSRAWVTTRQIPHVNFELTSQFSSSFKSFFIFMIHNSPVNFKLIHFLLQRKESHQSSNFKTFECSGENYQIPPVIFPNRRSVFLKFCITLQCHVR